MPFSVSPNKAINLVAATHVHLMEDIQQQRFFTRTCKLNRVLPATTDTKHQIAHAQTRLQMLNRAAPLQLERRPRLCIQVNPNEPLL